MKDNSILLVDSEKNILFTYQAILGEYYQVMIANSTQEAMKLLSKNSIDILITEFYLKGLNTLDFIADVRKNAPDIYIIMLTSTSLSVNHYKKIIESGVQDCFIKPFSINNLLVTIKKGLKMGALFREKDHLEKKICTIEKFLLNQKPQFCDKRFFLKEARVELERSNRYKGSFSIILLENTFHENDVTDALSDHLDNALLHKIRHTDSITRFNGTYVFLLPETNKEGIQHLCKRLDERVTAFSLKEYGNAHKKSDREFIFISATYPEEPEKITEIINAVEKAFNSVALD